MLTIKVLYNQPVFINFDLIYLTNANFGQLAFQLNKLN
jgi:hypothetical protein